jgi:hypothetical protein
MRPVRSGGARGRAPVFRMGADTHMRIRANP